MAQTMTSSHRIMSLNINGAYNDGANAWKIRAPLTLTLINRYRPDIIGLQEASKTNIDTFHEQLSEYSVVIGNRYGDTPPQDYTSVLYKSVRYELLASGEFWFSETPDIESADWGIEYPLGATWIKLKCLKTDQQLFYLNTHFEDGPWGEQSRVNASQLVINRLPQLAGDLPIVISGDFNCNPWSLPYRIFLDNGFSDTYRAAGNADSSDSNTFHAYQGRNYFALDFGTEIFWRVDWILAKSGIHRLQTTASAIVRDALPPTYPSDHYPIVSEIQFS
jgi:endonuclease/exonuclease/phosphatase family metal-dependent hydrolase